MQLQTEGAAGLVALPGSHLGWPFLLRTAISASPVVFAYLALFAIPFLEVDPRCYVVTVATVLAIGWGITGGYHRYFSHRSYKTSRALQLLIGCLGCLSLQKGPLWWAAKHRCHHRHADDEQDPHSPVRDGFWHAHMGWLFGRHQLRQDRALIKDLIKYPELMWLDCLWMAPGILFGAACYGTLGWAGVVVGYLLPVAIAFQLTFLVNSVGHLLGPQRFQTNDGSRNNIVLGYLTMGDGWHNNHHRVPYSARAGFAWYEADACYRIIWLLSRLGLVWDVKLPPKELLAGHDTRAVTQTPIDPAEEPAWGASAAAQVSCATTLRQG